MDSENKIYRDLQEFLNTLPGGFAATESGSDIQLLKYLFTPEEARVAVHLTMKPEPVKRIHESIRRSGNPVSLEELQSILDRMLYKGTLRPYYKGYNETHYRAPDPTAGGMLSVQLDHKLTREFYDRLNGYAAESFGKRTAGSKVLNPLRTVPVEKSITRPEKFPVSTYDNIRKMVEDATGPFAVANCICRQKTKRFGVKCAKTELEETCLMIEPDQARRYVDMGVGRYITREEVGDILDKAQQDGLVLQPENSQKPEAICICCGDCCVFLKPIKAHPRPVEFFLTNYYAEVDPELCNGCEICVDKCQMDARAMVDGIAVVNLDRCIGCGNCVAQCTSNANSLKKKELEHVPPEDKEAYYTVLLSHR
ncbi:MAG: 4Fe-4S binding protein [Dehalococcoidales bacterium]|nr:4Fe-4S binding protein [Dehalococcoidales bacterium]